MPIATPIVQPGSPNPVNRRSGLPVANPQLFDFELPPELEAHEPPEARGLARDEVRLMVSYCSPERILHAGFRDLPDFLRAGDVLVINTSATINAAVPAQRQDGSSLEIHFSTILPEGHWVVELRQPASAGSLPFLTASRGELLCLPGGARVTLLAPYRPGSSPARVRNDLPTRLWLAAVETPQPVEEYLAKYGFPIRYKHVPREWPLSYYQTVYADEPGSAEMPSAGRPFTQAILDRLSTRGVRIAPLLLHTGVASPEAHEPPPPEYFRVPAETAQAVNQAHRTGGRVIAVGTTVISALESVTAADRVTHPGEGWTELVVTPQRGIYVADGLLSGFHEPRSSHLLMLSALTSRKQLERSYREALQKRYLWHEFGDLHLMLP